MDLSEAKETLRELTVKYFPNITVAYAKQSQMVKEDTPLVMLTFGVINRHINPPTQIVDGRPVSYYETSVSVQIDLFTKGRKRKIAKGISVAYENTAAEDLTKFVDFLNSEYAIQYCSAHDIAIVIPNAVTDLTDLINDTSYEFRAMVEVELRFTSVAIGYSGTLAAESIERLPPEPGELPPTIDEATVFGDAELLMPKIEKTFVIPKTQTSPSGGGNEELLEGEDSYFTNVAVGDSLAINPDDSKSPDNSRSYVIKEEKNERKS